MSPTIQPFPQFTYPSQLLTVRDDVLKALGDDSRECQKIRSCKGSSLRCHSSFCPSCLRGRAYRDKGRILAACEHIPPSHLRAARFKSRDVALCDLRETGRILIDSGRKALGKLKVDGHVLRLETSFEEWSPLYHPHCHTILDSHSGGRAFVPSAAFEQEWLDALPAHLHPKESATHIAKVRDLGAACTYATKSPFFAHVSAEETARTVAAIRELKGLHRLSLRGSLNAAP